MDSQYETTNCQLPFLPQPQHQPHHHHHHHHDSHPQSQRPGRLPSIALLAHVNIHLKYLYPIMPVVSPEQVLHDSQDPLSLSPERYAFITALCAATHSQLELDEAKIEVDINIDSTSASLSCFSGIELLTEATDARGKCSNICEYVTVESLLTSFFLFATYGNLDLHDQAWFYLSQATTMAHTLGLHRENTYSEFGAGESEERRRVFWLLFVTERYVLALKPLKQRSLSNMFTDENKINK